MPVHQEIVDLTSSSPRARQNGTHSVPMPSSEDYNCPICLDHLLEPVVGACGHEFCKDCYAKWLSRSRTYPSCPLCRVPLSLTIPGVTRRLAELIEASFPDKMRQRRETREQDRQAEGAGSLVAAGAGLHGDLGHASEGLDGGQWMPHIRFRTAPSQSEAPDTHLYRPPSPAVSPQPPTGAPHTWSVSLDPEYHPGPPRYQGRESPSYSPAIPSYLNTSIYQDLLSRSPADAAQRSPSDVSEDAPRSPVYSQPSEPSSPADERPMSPVYDQLSSPADERPRSPENAQPSSSADERPRSPEYDQPSSSADDRPWSPARDRMRSPTPSEPLSRGYSTTSPTRSHVHSSDESIQDSPESPLESPHHDSPASAPHHPSQDFSNMARMEAQRPTSARHRPWLAYGAPRLHTHDPAGIHGSDASAGQLEPARTVVRPGSPMPGTYGDFSRLVQSANRLADASERLAVLAEIEGRPHARHEASAGRLQSAGLHYHYSGTPLVPWSMIGHVATAPAPPAPHLPFAWPELYGTHTAGTPGFAQAMPPPGVLPFTMGQSPVRAPRRNRHVTSASMNPPRFRKRMHQRRREATR